ncbi:MAG TPA: TetR/AcrR family transcriptional regulator [Terriglobia bacterium]|nr:TetR/AcrR family transcriptional regulator [Terriglobia bacterium]
MTGIRQKKHAKTQAAILRATAYLIDRKGFADTSIEDIASRAEVGVGTVYNYFGSKNALLLALMQSDTEDLLKEGEAVLARPPKKPEAALTELFWIYARGILGRYDRRMLREVFAAAFYQPEELGRELTRMDFQLMGQVGNLIEKFQSDGALRKSLPVQQAKIVLYGAFAVAVIMYLEYAEMPMESVREQMASSIDLILSDWRAPTPAGHAGRSRARSRKAKER